MRASEFINVNENFNDGRHPEDKGDSARHGIPKHATISTLRKIAKQGGRKGFGNGANIALFFSQMMLNDTTSTLKSLILLNPYNHFEKLVSTTMKQAIVGTKSGLQTNLLLDHMLHSVSESAELK